MPYLTLWDKISLNLAILKANSQKIFQISQNFQNILKHILWRNKYKSQGRNKTRDQRPGPGTKIRDQILSAEYGY